VTRRSPFWALASLVTTKDDASEFQVSLEDIRSGRGALTSENRSSYNGEGTSFAAGDVLFGKLRPYLSKWWRADRAGTAMGDIHVYRPNRGVDSRYLSYIVGSEVFVGYADASSVGAKMPRAEWSSIRQFRCELPDLDTQLRLASFLDQETREIDVIGDGIEDLVARLGTRVCERRRSELRGELVPLSVATRMKTGSTPKGVRTVEPGTEDSIPWVKPGDLDGKRQSAESSLPLGSMSESDIFPRMTPLVVGIGATLGKCGRFDHPVCANQQITALQPRPGLDPDYLFYALMNLTDELRATAHQSTIPITSNARLGTYRIPIPSLGEQRRIVEILDEESASIDAMIVKAEELKRLVAERRSALITEVITGRKEV